MKKMKKRNPLLYLALAISIVLLVLILLEASKVNALDLNFSQSLFDDLGFNIGTVMVAVALWSVYVIGWFTPVSAFLFIIGTIFIILALLTPEEYPDDQGDGSDVLEDEANLAKHLEEEREQEQVQAYCDRDIPPFSGKFLKKVLRTTNEYTYSYTITTCDKAKAFFVRLNGTDGLMKTEFRSLQKNQLFSNSETIKNRRSFSAVCLKIIGIPQQMCFGEE